MVKRPHDSQSLGERTFSLSSRALQSMCVLNFKPPATKRKNDKDPKQVQLKPRAHPTVSKCLATFCVFGSRKL
jgi:hypothetical protein